MEKRNLRPWMAVIFVLAFALDIFVVSGFLGMWFGVWGTLLHELLLALLAVLLAALFRADLCRVFPFKWPRASRVAGTLILWLGTFLAAMAVTMLVSYFFPQEVLGAGQGVQESKVRLCLLQAHPPGDIPGDHHRVLLADHRAPVLFQALHVIFPPAKDVHRLVHRQ